MIITINQSTNVQHIKHDIYLLADKIKLHLDDILYIKEPEFPHNPQDLYEDENSGFYENPCDMHNLTCFGYFELGLGSFTTVQPITFGFSTDYLLTPNNLKEIEKNQQRITKLHEKLSQLWIDNKYTLEDILK